MKFSKGEYDGSPQILNILSSLRELKTSSIYRNQLTRESVEEWWIPGIRLQGEVPMTNVVAHNARGACRSRRAIKPVARMASQEINAVLNFQLFRYISRIMFSV